MPVGGSDYHGLGLTVTAADQAGRSVEQISGTARYPAHLAPPEITQAVFR